MLVCWSDQINAEKQKMISFAAAVFFLIITPGPGVLSTAGVGSAFGFRAGFAYVTGLWAGNNFVSLIVITGLAASLLASDTIRTILMLLSTAYLFYLASRIIFAGAKIGFIKATSKPGLLSGIFLQLVNPKAYAVNTALFTSFAFMPDNIGTEIILKLVIFNLIWIPIHLLWLYMGVQIHQLNLAPTTTRLINIIMGLSLSLVVVLSLLSLS